MRQIREMTLPIYVVDAFAEGLFSGNPAAVIPLEDWLDDQLMQKIAQENNQAETAFILPIKGAWHIRWFTPTVEVNICGHATIASAHVISKALDQPSERIKFWSRSGWLHVDIQGDEYTLDLPADELTTHDPPPFMFEALGVDVLGFWKGREDFLTLVADSQQLRKLNPDLTLIARLKARGLIVTAPDETYDFVSRCFFPQSGIDEDPATGSGHATLTKFWSERTNKTSFTAYQASERGALVHCSLHGDRVSLTGKAITYLTGHINLP